MLATCRLDPQRFIIGVKDCVVNFVDDIVIYLVAELSWKAEE